MNIYIIFKIIIVYEDNKFIKYTYISILDYLIILNHFFTNYTIVTYYFLNTNIAKVVATTWHNFAINLFYIAKNTIIKFIFFIVFLFYRKIIFSHNILIFLIRIKIKNSCFVLIC